MHTDVQHAAFSPDGRLLATANGDDVRIWNLAKGEQILELESDRAEHVVFSPDSRMVATSGTDGTRLRGMPDGHEILQLWGADAIYMFCATFSSDGCTLAAVGDDGAFLYDLPGGDEIMRLELLEDDDVIIGADAAFSPDGRMLAVGSNGSVGAWIPQNS